MVTGTIRSGYLSYWDTLLISFTNRGKKKKVTDTLSQKLPETQFNLITMTCKIKWEELWKDLDLVDSIVAIKQKITNGEEVPAGYMLESGRVLYKGWLVLNRHSFWIPKLFSEFQDRVIGGHS